MPADAAPSAKLAYITDDSGLAAVEIGPDGPDGAEPRLLLDMETEGMVFMWPSWSPDGGTIAVSASANRKDGRRMELWRTSADGGGAMPLYENPEGGRQVIAPGLAHYAAWAPQGAAMALAGNTGDGLSLSLVAAKPGPAPRRLAEGAPLYLAWSPDGRALLIHRGAQLLLFDLAGDEAGPRPILRARATFRAPVWTADGRHFIYGAPKAGSASAIYRGRRQPGGEAEELLELPSGAAFVRAPHDDRLALIGIQHEDAAQPRDGVTVLYLDERASRRISERPANAAFWTPDGRSLIVFEPTPSSTMITVSRYDLDRGGAPPAPLARFQPSAEYAAMLAFFDQFADSHRIISPDGKWVAIAGLALGNGGSSRRGFGPQNGCYVVPVDGSRPPRRVAAGSIGFFSPAGAAP